MEHLILSVSAPKGGVGKTTTAINISIALALKQKKILLVDVDPGGYCSSAFGYDEEKIFGNITDLYLQKKKIQEVVHKTELSYLELIPSKGGMNVQELANQQQFTDVDFLKKALHKIREEYDYLIIDCPPSFNGFTYASLVASDYVLVPVQSSNFSLEAANRMIRFIDYIRSTANPNLKLDGFLLTMHERNTRASFHTKKTLYNLYPNKIFRTSIPKNITVAESTFHNRPVILFEPNASASKAYFEFVEELLEKHETTSLMLLSGFDNNNF